MCTFDKKQADVYISKLLKKHKITVSAWSRSSCGWAQLRTRRVKIPQPTNVDRLGVCLHEIFHIIGRKGSNSFEKEFYCDMYARGIIIELGYDATDWDKRTKWHILSRIAMAHNRGLNHASIKPDIREFFKGIDFTKWIGNKVFVGHAYYKSLDPADIKFTCDMSKIEIEKALGEKGMVIEKSQADDSTYGHYIVRRSEAQFGSEYGSLSEVIRRFNLIPQTV